MTITVLPWRHASELAFVRDCFYPHHAPPSSTLAPDLYAALHETLDPSSNGSTQTRRTDNYHLALSRVRVWTFRSPITVPHAVSATAGLVDAKLHDELGYAGTGTRTVVLSNLGSNESPAESRSLISDFGIKAIYAMAFLRFVNGFVDRDVVRSTHKTGLSNLASSTGPDAMSDDDESEIDVAVNVNRAGESSMYAHAVAIGMPSAFVDLRHRCVHGDLPDLALLRKMSEKALEWLWERWWRGNAPGDSGRWLWEVEMEKEAREAAKERRRVLDGAVAE